MKKSDLETIIKKIQNRCYLENPTRITYYWNEDHKVVFKIFFESLYLPKDLRIDKDNIQNTFITQNVYEYEDDFTILELNQDEGYIKVLPDDQNFKIINSYKDANKEENIEESKKVHLTTKNLKEVFALSRGYILQEQPQNSKKSQKILNPENANIQKAKETKEKVKKIDASIYVISIAFNLCNQALDKSGILNKALDTAYKMVAKAKKSKSSSKLVFTIPKVIKEDLSATDLNSLRNFSNNLTEKFKDSYAYFGGNGNSQFASILENLNVKKTYYLTSTAEEAIKNANLPELLATAVKNKKYEIVEDTTKDILIQAREAAEKMIEKYSKTVSKEGGVHKDFSKTKSGKSNWDKRRAYLKSKLNPKVNAALSFCMDLYSINKNNKDVEAAQERKKIIDDVLKNAKNLGNSQENIAWYKQAAILIQNSPKLVLAGITNTIKNIDNEKTVKSQNIGLIKNQDFGGQTAGYTTKKTKTEIPVESKDLKVTDYYTDFPIKIAVNEKGDGFNEDFDQFVNNFFYENVQADDIESVSNKDKENQDNENQEKESQDKDKELDDKESEDKTVDKETAAEESDDTESNNADESNPEEAK